MISRNRIYIYFEYIWRMSSQTMNIYTCILLWIFERKKKKYFYIIDPMIYINMIYVYFMYKIKRMCKDVNIFRIKNIYKYIIIMFVREWNGEEEWKYNPAKEKNVKKWESVSVFSMITLMIIIVMMMGMKLNCPMGNRISPDIKLSFTHALYHAMYVRVTFPD